MLRHKTQDRYHRKTPDTGAERIKNTFLVSCVMCLVTAGLLMDVCWAQPVKSSELIDNAKNYDGKIVTYTGEAVGDIMARNAFAWVNLNDGENAIGIWLRKDLAGEINYTGSYKSRGDIIEITGVFHRACPEHGGDLDIHAQSLRKISSGKKLSQPLSPDKRNIALILFGALCLALLLNRYKKA